MIGVFREGMAGENFRYNIMEPALELCMKIQRSFGVNKEERTLVR